MQGFYINLDERPDRNHHITTICGKYPIFKNIRRFSGLKNSNGSLGCSMSHLECLKRLKQDISISKTTSTSQMPNYVIVMEDDFFIYDDAIFQSFLNDFNKIKDIPNNDEWHLITLTPSGDTIREAKQDKKYSLNNFLRIKNNQTMTCYIINMANKDSILFLDLLIERLNLGVENMKKGGSIHVNICDQIWKSLQHNYTFLYYKDIFAGQIPNYSNIENKNVNYMERFINQPKY